MPYYIYGDETGAGNEEVPVRAYRAVSDEIALQERSMGVRFDRVYIALGTGMSYVAPWRRGCGQGEARHRDIRRPLRYGRIRDVARDLAVLVGGLVPPRPDRGHRPVPAWGVRLRG